MLNSMDWVLAMVNCNSKNSIKADFFYTLLWIMKELSVSLSLKQTHIFLYYMTYPSVTWVVSNLFKYEEKEGAEATMEKKR